MNFFCRRLSTLLHTGILPRFPPTDDLRTTTCQYPSVFFCRRSPKFPFNDVFPKLPSTDVFPRTFCQAPHIFFFWRTLFEVSVYWRSSKFSDKRRLYRDLSLSFWKIVKKKKYLYQCRSRLIFIQCKETLSKFHPNHVLPRYPPTNILPRTSQSLRKKKVRTNYLS